ncbi:glycosyltransferase family 4 protein [Cyclobacterium sp. SYSU L10401]|uniref:glycosyltransferase family 4 protein n=1 Tax=Cyclobacterium sp. SYSU L10401 TaxID=2678657 RepID=UPI0013D01749|nr:glycosyltransferase family 4 protein [Cyclobacterium sp. SYSU L10401]
MNILFVSWDSDQTNYLENLFFPIFRGIQDRRGWQFHVMQFSWAGPAEVERIRSLAREWGICYRHVVVHRKPAAAVGAIWTMVQGRRALKKYLQEHPITCLMPRATLPALMVNLLGGWLQNKGISIVFDADGLPIQERVDFAGLKPGSLQYRWLKNAETKMLARADKVLTRTNKAIQIHGQSLRENDPSRFYRISNGRDPGFFKPDPEKRAALRKELGVAEDGLLWIYSGSLGPPYQPQDMLRLFWSYQQLHTASRFLFLVREGTDLKAEIPAYLEELVWIKTVPFQSIPDYYSAGDLGISLRKPAPSLAGLAPIKVGEYLLSGLPVLLSDGIGDLSQELGGEAACFVYNDNTTELHAWLSSLKPQSKAAARQVGMEKFGLDQSVNAYIQALDSLQAH